MKRTADYLPVIANAVASCPHCGTGYFHDETDEVYEARRERCAQLGLRIPPRVFDDGFWYRTQQCPACGRFAHEVSRDGRGA